jgi:S1-C subfamily serine protease
MPFARTRNKLFSSINLPLAISLCILAAGCTQQPPEIGRSTPPPATTPRGVTTAHGLPLGENTVADIAEDAVRSVVNIDTKTSVVVPDYGYHVFDFFGEGMAPRQNRLEIAGTGTGVIIRADGYILTNNHVVKQANEISVTLNDKRVLKGKVIGRDKFTDLALVKIPANNLPVARLGTAKTLRPGEWAIAIGSPAGLSNTVTLGIISAIGRSVGELGDVGLIQTDTAINPGNSGGPLLNLQGEVVGINTAIRKDYQNIGFAIPIDNAKQVAQALLSTGTVKHPYLGIAMQDLNGQLDKALGLPEDTRGVIVAKVSQGSPAEDAGLQAGDVINKIDNTPVATAKEVQKIVTSHSPGDSMTIVILRNGSTKSLTVNVGDYPDQQQQPESGE